MQFVIVTGLSGAGKSYAMNVLEDIGFYCIDNMPPKLILKFIKICIESNYENIAIAVDIRSGEGFSDAMLSTFEHLKNEFIDYKILYLEATNEVLVKRYKQTRRKHPLSVEFNGSLSKSISFEREKLNSLREIANYYIDTSYLSTSQLKENILNILLKDNNFARAKEIAAWKLKIAEGWDKIEVVSMDIPEGLLQNPQVSEVYHMNIVIDIKDINDKGIGIELVVTKPDKDNKFRLHDLEEFKLVKTEGSLLYFSLDYQLNRAGLFQFGFRMFPKNEDLPHRQDFCYVRWL